MLLEGAIPPLGPVPLCTGCILPGRAHHSVSDLRARGTGEPQAWPPRWQPDHQSSETEPDFQSTGSAGAPSLEKNMNSSCPSGNFGIIIPPQPGWEKGLVLRTWMSFPGWQRRAAPPWVSQSAPNIGSPCLSCAPAVKSGHWGFNCILSTLTTLHQEQFRLSSCCPAPIPDFILMNDYRQYKHPHWSTSITTS